MSEPTCTTCPYGSRAGEFTIECRSNPTPRNKRHNQWCSLHPARQRDRVAQRALQGLLAGRPGMPPELAARMAYRFADALDVARVGADEASAEEADCA